MYSTLHEASEKRAKEKIRRASRQYDARVGEKERQSSVLSGTTLGEGDEKNGYARRGNFFSKLFGSRKSSDLKTKLEMVQKKQSMSTDASL
ncbi:hypothetical protein LTR51_008777 [Lithohypha guttulata]|nr:hypothetical protein LTR51_008777 [Lithohypha guttulata]